MRWRMMNLCMQLGKTLAKCFLLCIHIFFMNLNETLGAAVCEIPGTRINHFFLVLCEEH